MHSAHVDAVDDHNRGGGRVAQWLRLLRYDSSDDDGDDGGNVYGGNAKAQGRQQRPYSPRHARRAVRVVS